MEENEYKPLKRGLKNRHIQLIALGGAVGTGLFLGTAETIKQAGPAVIISYFIGGFIAFLIMRQLGEMIAQEPIVGSFSNIAHKYWGDFAGFLSGWNYWFLYILVGMAELTAIGIYVNYWYPGIETWKTVAFFFLLINLINLNNVKIFGELEFWFASIKIVAIIGMIILGSYLLMTSQPGDTSTVSNLWVHGGFFAKGGYGVFISLAVVMFSFGGLELVGIAAAEADNPRKTIPRAVNQVIYRILIFYIGALIILLALYPWNLIGSSSKELAVQIAASPFVYIFDKIGIPSAANILNFIILTAALSVYNSSVYCNSRMLLGLAVQKNAPKIFASTNAQGVPVAALALSSAATLLCVIMNYIIPKEVLGMIMSLVVACLVINWALISLTHMKFREKKEKDGELIFFKSFLYPYTNYICLLFMALILVILWIENQKVAVLVMPAWVVFISLCYLIKRSMQNNAAHKE